LLETPPRVVAAQLQTAVPATYLNEKSVYNWYNDFKDGKRTDITDLPRSGRPRETTTEENKEMVRQLILESDGMRTEDLLHETGIPNSSLMRLLNEIGARKLKSRWIPHELTPRQRQARYCIAGKHYARYQQDYRFVDRIVAIDETWLKSYDPEDSRQSSEWLLPGQKA
jgi:transposase